MATRSGTFSRESSDSLITDALTCMVDLFVKLPQPSLSNIVSPNILYVKQASTEPAQDSGVSAINRSLSSAVVPLFAMYTRIRNSGMRTWFR